MKSTTPLHEITAAAREKLSGNWGSAIGVMVSYYILVQGGSLLPFAMGLLSLLYTGPLLVGVSAFFISLLRGTARFRQLFDGFNCFGRSFGTYLLMSLFIMLWTLLLIIPGIIKTYSYAMAFFIVADDPSTGASDAITRSRRMMDGNKWRLFCLYLRFVGWGILCLFTLGIGFLWLWPYMMAATAAFYEDVKD